jgi:hypothetical protein
VKEPRHDDERLAALLDGRLEGPERDELLAYLATADEDLYVFARTAAALRGMEEQEAAQAQRADESANDPPARETPPSVRPGWRRWKAPRAIVPAVIAGLLVLGIFVTRGRAASAGDPAQLASLMGDEALPQGWLDIPAGTGSRGSVERRAAEAGKLLLDLAVSIRAGDSARTATLAKQIHARFDDQALPSSPIAQIERRTTEPASVLLPLVEQQTERLSARLDRDYLQLGAWTEAALIAAERQDADFFRAGATRTMLRRAARITRDNPAQRAALQAVRATLDAPGTPQWGGLKTQLRTLMGAITS